MKILIADHSRVMRQIVARTLRQVGFDGHDVVEAANGLEALDVIAAESPDLVLSDWDMPQMTGIELLATLRAQGTKVPFGFVTSEGSPEMRDKAEAAGALFLITKPFTAGSFRDALEGSSAEPSHTADGTGNTDMSTTLPTPKAVRDMFEELLGRDVEVALALEPLVPSERELASVAVYVDDALRMAAIVVTDLALSAVAGAAIGLIPKAGAEACVADRALFPMVRDNLDEVLNIAATLFNLPGRPHLKLYGVHSVGDLPPTDVSALMRAIGHRLDLTVSVAGYGAGRLAILL